VIRRLAPVILALLLAPSASASLPHPCTLLTNAEVTKAFGTKIATRTGDANRYGCSCTWQGVTAGSFTSYHARLSVDVAPATRAAFATAAKRAKNAVPVHDLGELAYSQYMAGEFLSVWQHGIALSVGLGGGTTPIASAKALARAALARLP
jgi:hypothetical protein